MYSAINCKWIIYPVHYIYTEFLRYDQMKNFIGVALGRTLKFMVWCALVFLDVLLFYVIVLRLKHDASSIVSASAI